MDGSNPPFEDATSRIWCFADAEYDEARRELRVGGVLQTVEARPLAVLQELLARGDEVATRQELLDIVWQATVTDQSLTTAIAKLRTALGPEGRTIVEAVHGIGYKIGVPITLRAGPERPRLAFTLRAGEPVPNRPQWRLERSLGSNARDVWLARHEKTGERRVFKFADTIERRSALQREAALSRILHNALGHRPDFVRINEWSFATRPAFLESFFGGESLPEWIAARGSLALITLDDRIAIVARIARTVAAAHDVGVLHRDIKPSNVLMMDEGKGLAIRLVDFGSGRLTDAARLDAITVTGLSLTASSPHDGERLSGTIRYMAPEVFRGGPPTIAADVYALGVMLYQMAIGDLDRPLAVGWESEIDDEILLLDVAAAASGNVARRIASASILAERLETVEARRQFLKQQAIEAVQRERLLRDAEDRRAEAAIFAREAVLAFKHAQRMRVAAWSLTGLLVIAASLAVYGHLEQRIALAQRHRAEQITEVTRTAVSSLVNDMTVSLREKPGVPLSVLQAILTEAEGTLARMSDLVPEDKQLQRLHARALTEFADTYLHQGNLDEALDAGEHAVRLQRTLLASDSLNANLKEDLASSERWVGDVKLKRRDFQSAISAYAVAVQMTTELVRLDPKNPLYQQRLARSEEAIAMVQMAQQQPASALSTGRIAQRILLQGSPASLARPDWQLNLATSTERIGDALEALGEKHGALASYETALAMMKRLVVADVSNMRWLRDLDVAYSEVGDEQWALGELQDALVSYKAGMVIGEKLAGMDSANMLLKRDVATGYDEIANVETDLGDFQAAESGYDKAIEVIQAVLLRSPTDESFQHDLAAINEDFSKMFKRPTGTSAPRNMPTMHGS